MLWGKDAARPFTAPAGAEAVQHFFLARNAIYHGLSALQISAGERVLAPAYHCETAIEPIVRYGARVEFYGVRRDAIVDLDDIRGRITKDTRAILAIHYFGILQPILELRKLCDEHGIYLIEDCAHVLTDSPGVSTLGTIGDVSVFAWRKFLPIDDGGQFVINNPELRLEVTWDRPGLSLSLRVGKDVLNRLIDDSGSRMLKTLYALVHLPYKVLRRVRRKMGRDRPDIGASRYTSKFDISVIGLGMTTLAQRVCRKTDLSEVVRRRRLNHAALRHRMMSRCGIDSSFPDPPEGVCSWAYPVLFTEKENVHLALRSLGIPAFTWGGVVHPSLPKGEFPDAEFLYDNLVLLPIHQDIGEREMNSMVDGIRLALESHG
jgi:dTDP-4-amino-4,6-dideoxygalactose transaminase